MKLIKSILVLSIAAFLITTGCKLEEPSITSSADVDLNEATVALLSSYVSLGNSLTAGYQSGALTEKFQVNSFVKQIATQAGVGDDFVQPLMGYPGIGTYTEDGAGVMELAGFDASGNPIIGPVPYVTVPSFNPLLPYLTTDIMTYPAPYSNLGIPGIVLADLSMAISTNNSPSGSGLINPILRNPFPVLGNTTPIEQALALNPTLITCWIGNNDVLGYATSGGYSPDAPSMDGASFEALYGATLTAITAGGADVVVANIPDVTTLPFFTTIGPKIAASLIAGQVPYPLAFEKAGDDLATGPATGSATTDDLLAGTVYVTLVASPYASLVGTPTGAWYRGIAADMGIPVSALLGTMPVVDTTQAFGLHPQNPIPHPLVLDADEIAIASGAIADFNAAIVSAAGENIPVVDMNAFMADMADGYHVSGLSLSADFLTGGVFSLDGVHPNDLGYALIANEFIETINANFDTNVPIVNISEFILPAAAKVSKSGTVKSDIYLAIPEAFGGKIR